MDTDSTLVNTAHTRRLPIKGILILDIVSPCYSRDQDICGFCTDSDNRQPSIRSLCGATSVSTQTDRGEYSQLRRIETISIIVADDFRLRVFVR